MFGRRRDFADGFGFCSLGRWAPWQRRCADDMPSLAFSEQPGETLFEFLKGRLDLGKLAKEFAAGVIVQCPFSDVLIADCHEIPLYALESRVTTNPGYQFESGLRVSHSFSPPSRSSSAWLASLISNLFSFKGRAAWCRR